MYVSYQTFLNTIKIIIIFFAHLAALKMIHFEAFSGNITESLPIQTETNRWLPRNKHLPCLAPVFSRGAITMSSSRPLLLRSRSSSLSVSQGLDFFAFFGDSLGSFFFLGGAFGLVTALAALLWDFSEKTSRSYPIAKGSSNHQNILAYGVPIANKELQWGDNFNFVLY